MKSIPLISGGRVIGRACYRERVRRCYTCGFNAELTCDGCDHVLCARCACSPREGLDFCGHCFGPAYKHWTQFNPVHHEREARRAAFRAWAVLNAELFLSLSKPRTKKSLKEIAP